MSTKTWLLAPSVSVLAATIRPIEIAKGLVNQPIARQPFASRLSLAGMI